MEAIQFNFIAIMLRKEGKDTKMGFKNAKEWDRGNVVQCTKGKGKEKTNSLLLQTNTVFNFLVLPAAAAESIKKSSGLPPSYPSPFCEAPATFLAEVQGPFQVQGQKMEKGPFCFSSFFARGNKWKRSPLPKGDHTLF